MHAWTCVKPPQCTQPSPVLGFSVPWVLWPAPHSAPGLRRMFPSSCQFLQHPRRSNLHFLHSNCHRALSQQQEVSSGECCTSPLRWCPKGLCLGWCPSPQVTIQTICHCKALVVALRQRERLRPVGFVPSNSLQGCEKLTNAAAAVYHTSHEPQPSLCNSKTGHWLSSP